MGTARAEATEQQTMATAHAACKVFNLLVVLLVVLLLLL
jgi:hypothetical protein